MRNPARGLRARISPAFSGPGEGHLVSAHAGASQWGTGRHSLLLRQRNTIYCTYVVPFILLFDTRYRRSAAPTVPGITLQILRMYGGPKDMRGTPFPA